MAAVVRAVTDDDFDEAVQGAGRPGLVGFWVPWCGG
ncbi:thioredoxin domain-containing protein, partial [Streptomyces sp. GbtcB6]